MSADNATPQPAGFSSFAYGFVIGLLTATVFWLWMVIIQLKPEWFR